MEKIQTKTPSSYLMILAGMVLALLTLFGSIIGFLSIKQAPPSPPVVETE